MANPLSSFVHHTAKAAFPEFVSEAEGSEPNTFLLEWTTRSHTPISVFSVSYRESGDDDWQGLEVKPSEANARGEGLHYKFYIQ